ncbi:MAG: hypothetical protein ACTS8R_05000 [Arsenophonus sp. NC-QC1-MAG3]
MRSNLSDTVIFISSLKKYVALSGKLIALSADLICNSIYMNVRVLLRLMMVLEIWNRNKLNLLMA